METIIGIVIGLVVGIGAALVVSAVRRRQAEWNQPQNRSASASIAQDSSDDEEEFQEPEPDDPKQIAYRELQVEYNAASIREEYTALKTKLESKKSTLTTDDYDYLLGQTNNMLSSLEQEERERAEFDAKIQQFRDLRTQTDREELFTDLHHILLLRDEDHFITYDELENYGEQEDLDWAARTYDELVLERLGQLIDAAGSPGGTVEDYNKVREFYGELWDNSYTNADGNEIDDVMSDELKDAWNNMVVRFVREPDTSDDLYGYDDLDEDDYRKIIKGAREHDLLSLRLLTMLSADGNIDDTLIEVFVTEFQTDLDAQHLALGFKSGEDVRTA